MKNEAVGTVRQEGPRQRHFFLLLAGAVADQDVKPIAPDHVQNALQDVGKNRIAQRGDNNADELSLFVFFDRLRPIWLGT